MKEEIEPCPACGSRELSCACSIEDIDAARAHREAEALTDTLIEVPADERTQNGQLA